jgi:hypothetical protein
MVSNEGKVRLRVIPKIESTTRSDLSKAAWKSSVNGISKSFNCFESRCHAISIHGVDDSRNVCRSSPGRVRSCSASDSRL